METLLKHRSREASRLAHLLNGRAGPIGARWRQDRQMMWGRQVAVTCNDFSIVAKLHGAKVWRLTLCSRRRRASSENRCIALQWVFNHKDPQGSRTSSCSWRLSILNCRSWLNRYSVFLVRREHGEGAVNGNDFRCRIGRRHLHKPRFTICVFDSLERWTAPIWAIRTTAANKAFICAAFMKLRNAWRCKIAPQR